MPPIQPIRPRVGFEVLDADQLQDIRSATLHILESVGVHCPSERALGIFAEHGAPVNWDAQNVRLPAELVTKAMAHAPRAYWLAGRDPATDLYLDGTHSYFSTDGCGVEVIDLVTRRSRPSTKQDVADTARISDYLSSVAFYWPMVSAQDHGSLAPLHELDASYNNTVKHVQSETAMGARTARYAVRMAEVIAGDRKRMRQRPPLSILICTIAPLGLDKEGIEAGMVYAEAGIPVGYMAMPTLGSTAPVKTGAALVVGNAEVVSAMVLMQLVAPGAPVYHSLLASVMDPRTAGYIAGIPDKYLANVAAVQLAHDWGVPALAGSFGVDAAEPASWQLGRDSVYSALLCALAGAEMASGLGMLRASTLLAPEQIIFDDEIYHTHRVLAEGIDTGPDGLALDVIKDVGPRGHFLAHKHTRRAMRELWIPKLTHPGLATGGQPEDIRERARAHVTRILADHRPEPLDPTRQKELKTILAAAERDIGA